MVKPYYRNITITGKVCTGTSTLSRLLVKKLGWQHWDAGTYFRQYCRKHQLKLEDMKRRSDVLRRKVDYQVRSRLKNKQHLIHEGWLAGFFAQGIPGVLKVLLVCNDSLRVDRLVNRDGYTVDEAKIHIEKREAENEKTWRKTYFKEWQKWVAKKKIDFFDPELFDLVIDTYSHSRQETLNLVLQALGRK